MESDEVSSETEITQVGYKVLNPSSEECSNELSQKYHAYIYKVEVGKQYLIDLTSIGISDVSGNNVFLALPYLDLDKSKINQINISFKSNFSSEYYFDRIVSCVL